jgi:hypothetical protein
MLKFSARNCGIAASALLLALAASVPPARAAAAEMPSWCALVQAPEGGYVTCSYFSRAQCAEALAGVGGICHENPAIGSRQPVPQPAGRGHRRTMDNE